jgi:hypothetical protein
MAHFAIPDQCNFHKLKFATKVNGKIQTTISSSTY